MKKRVLKNERKEYVNGWFRGRVVSFGPKHSRGFDLDDEEERALYYYWKETYAMRDITHRMEGSDKDEV